MPGFDRAHFDPPAPVASVTLRHPQTGVTVTGVPLLVDTGADVTLLPRAAVQRLGVPFLAGVEYELEGFDGSTSALPVAVLDMLFLGRAFRGRYLVRDGEPGILGRDVLNHVTQCFDGPEQHWSERSP